MLIHTLESSREGKGFKIIPSLSPWQETVSLVILSTIYGRKRLTTESPVFELQEGVDTLCDLYVL